MKKRGKYKIKRRMLSGVMVAVMVLSAVDVSGWRGVVAKAADEAQTEQEKEVEIREEEANEDFGGFGDLFGNDDETTGYENGFAVDTDGNTVYQPAILTTDKYDVDGDGNYDEVYEISNAGQLYWFADKVNNENDTYGSVNAVLTADIVVNENVLKSDGTLNDGTFKEWTPIGVDYTDDLNKRHEYSYTGAFDGQNHTISGLYCKKNSAWNIGLFGFIGSGGKIANVGVLDSYFSETGSVGGVCGINTGGIIINCYNTGTVNGQYDIGGVCGHSGGGTIINCYNTGVVNGYEDVGGVSGFNGSLLTNCNSTGTVSGSQYIGGVSGINNGGTITNCYYDSTIYTGNAIGTDIETTTTNVEGKTTEQYKTGEVAYLLQLDQSEAVWGQTIGTDTYPTLGGAKVYKNATYNGCEGKPGDAVSYEYSNTEKNTYGEHSDADNDGKCDVCNAIIDGIGAKLAGYSLSLAGNIGVNFYMELSDKILTDEDAYMQITLPNGTVTKVLVSDAQTNTEIKEGTTYYRFPCEVASYEMTQDIKAQMFDGNGNWGKEYTYTVRDYAKYIIENDSLYVDAISFVVTMLDYGACSQKYFKVAVDDLANKELNPSNDISGLDSDYMDDFAAKKAEDDVLGQFAGLNMVLESETTLNIFYEPKEGIDVSKLTFSVDGKEVTPEKRGQYYILSLENIKANELETSKTFTVTDGTNTLSGDYCAMMYCYQVLNAAEGTYEDDLVTLVKAFSAYAYNAKSVCRSN